MPVKVGLRHIEIWNDSLEPAVCEYEKEELHKGEIVFYGPSYYTRWATKYGNTPLREALTGKSGAQCAVNRGFGSSCAEHQLYYYPRMVRPLEPSVLVYSSFENGPSFGYTPDESFELAQRVVMYALTDFPGIHIYLCGPHYTLKTKGDAESNARKARYSELLTAFADTVPNCRYLDVLNHEPLRRDDIFIADGVHYNSVGYKLYADYYREALGEELCRF